MSQYTHFVPVGHTRETLISSIKELIKEYPVSKVILILGKNEQDESEQKARKVADDVEKELSFIKFDRTYTDLFDVLTAASDLVLRARQEQAKGLMVLFNLSGSLRTVDIAGYIASVITKSESCVGVPDYKDGKICGIKKVYPIPKLPSWDITDSKIKVLGLLDDEKWKTLDDLSKEFDPDSEIKLESKKSKMSFHMNDLKKLEFIETVRDKKTLLVRRTKLGRVFYNGLS